MVDMMDEFSAQADKSQLDAIVIGSWGEPYAAGGSGRQAIHDAGTVALVALVSPIRSARESMAASLPEGDFIEVYCDCPLDVCKARAPKGMYAKAEQGLIANFTGVSAPYEALLAPAVMINTGSESVDASVQCLLTFLRPRLLID